MSLGWERHFLMCPPEHFAVLYEINPWMHQEVAVDLDRARSQWDGLVTTLEEAGATVEVLDPQPGLPDLVFTANAGLVNGKQYIPSRFRHPQRRDEVSHDIDWFERRGYRIDELPEGVSHEGAGDALPFGGVLVTGAQWRSDAAAHALVSRLTGTPVQPVELVDERFYHLDMTFCPLDDRRAMLAPGAWDEAGRKAMEALVPEPLVLDEEATLQFCANSVVVGRTVIMPACPPAVGRQLEAWGFEVEVVDVSEFQKAGGACRCLTLALDVELGG